MEKRTAGILLHISSLPSNYGIGTLGLEAYKFIDKLVKSNMKYWQVLPIGPTSFGDSPYQPFSAFAGNPYLIDLDLLIDENLISSLDVEEILWFKDEDCVDFDILWQYKFKILRKAFENSYHLDNLDYKNFLEKNSIWLDDYALFMACKSHFNNKSWLDWDEDIKKRTEKAIEKYTKLLINDIDFYKFIQFKFFEQWKILKNYAKKKNVSIIGDIPIYVALDSADIWANPKIFLLDKDLNPSHIAGCPPDGFSADGQKWGNPLYNWQVLEENNFEWWRNRMKFSSEIYDVIRIDHFIGIERYFSIPVKGEAKDGFYTTGPREKLIDAINESIGEAKIIAEDLGVLTKEVLELLEKSKYPGMKVLQFAFDSNNENLYLPHNHVKNSVLYIGTHDNDTLLGYLDTTSENTLNYLKDYLDCNDDEIHSKLIRMAFSSVSNTLILQMQDILKKDGKSRMNFPSTTEKNWCYRMKNDEFTISDCENLSKLCEIYGRNN